MKKRHGPPQALVGEVAVLAALEANDPVEVAPRGMKGWPTGRAVRRRIGCCRCHRCRRWQRCLPAAGVGRVSHGTLGAPVLLCEGGTVVVVVVVVRDVAREVGQLCARMGLLAGRPQGAEPGQEVEAENFSDVTVSTQGAVAAEPPVVPGTVLHLRLGVHVKEGTLFVVAGVWERQNGD